jgi:hypothetical protein
VRRVAALAAATALVAGGCAARSAGSERFAASAPAWTLAGRPFEMRVTSHGGLARRPVTYVVSVEAELLGSYVTEQGVAVVPVPARALRAGRNRIEIETGNEHASLAVRVVPLAAPAAALALAALAGLLALRRRRRAGA